MMRMTAVKVWWTAFLRRPCVCGAVRGRGGLVWPSPAGLVCWCVLVSFLRLVMLRVSRHGGEVTRFLLPVQLP